MLSFGDLRKRSTSRSSTSPWKILDDGIMPARFLCLSGFRIRSTVAEAQETLTVERTCLLLVSPQAVLSPHEYPARGWGKGRWRGCQRELEDGAEDGGDQTKYGRWGGSPCLLHDRQMQAGEPLFPLTTTWLHPLPATGTLPLLSGGELRLRVLSPIHVFCRLRHTSSLPDGAGGGPHGAGG